jgi:hypothetical protein
MHGYQELFDQHVPSTLGAGEKVEASALLYSGPRKYFVAAATNKRLILVEAEVGRLRSELAYKGVRKIPYSTIASVRSWGFLNQKRLIVHLQSGDTLRFGLNTLLTSAPDQKRFVTTVKELYQQHVPEVEADPAPLEEPTFDERDLVDTTKAQPQVAPNLGSGVLAGSIAAGISAVVWATITIIT